MKVPMYAKVAIFIAMATVMCCCSSVSGGEYEQRISGDVTEAWMSSRACTNSESCLSENYAEDSGESDVDGDYSHNHHTPVRLYTESQADSVDDSSHGSAKYLDQTAESPIMIFNEAAKVWGQTDDLLKSLKRFKKDIDQMPINPRLQLNRKAIQSSILDLQDQLEQKVFSLIAGIQQAHGKSVYMSPISSARKIDRAKDTLREVTKTNDHLIKVVQQKIRQFKEDTMKIKENAYNIWKMVPKVQKDLSSIFVKLNRLYGKGMLPKQAFRMNLKNLKQQEVVLQQDVIQVLRQFQPFNKPTANFQGGDATLEECRKILSNMVQQLKRMEEKLQSGQNKIHQDIDHDSVESRGNSPSKNNQPIDYKSKRCVKNYLQNSSTFKMSYLRFTVLFVGLVVCFGFISVSLRHGIKQKKMTLPLTVYDN